jgi:hypothetical protein
MQDRLVEAARVGRWGNLPTMEELDQWHIESLIEEMGFIREDLGLYRRLLKKPDLWPENRARVKNLTELDKKRLEVIRAEIEELRNGQKTDQRGVGRVSGAGQGSFQF